MDKLLLIINGLRSDSLTIAEIRNIVREINSNKTMSSIYHFYIISAIRSEKLLPDMIMSLIVSEWNSNSDAILPGICLSYGANPNGYFSLEGLGNAHLIVYLIFTVHKLNISFENKNRLVYPLYLLFLLKGADVTRPAFLSVEETPIPPNQMDEQFLDLVNLPSTTPLKKPVHRQTVAEWIVGQGYSLLSLDKELRENLEIKQYLGLAADNPALNAQPLIQNVVIARSINILNGMNLESIGEEMILCESLAIRLSITNLWFEMFKIFTDLGIMTTYFSLNRLLISLRDYYRQGNMLAVNCLQDMLLYAIAHGLTIDMDQMAIISTTSEPIAVTVLEAYKKPFWKKICNGTPGKYVSDGLKRLAFHLNLEYTNKEAICSAIESYSMADKRALKEAVIRRNKSIVSASVSSVADFISGTPREVVCQNNTILQTDPFEYGDASMSYYKDDSEITWCFLSNVYEDLISTGVNPNTKKPLPETFIFQVKSQLDILRKVGISPSNPVSTLEAIDNLSLEDNISGVESEFIKDTIFHMAATYGISTTDIGRLNVIDLNNVLKRIQAEQYSLEYLTGGHRINTFCRAAYFAIKENNNNSKIFLQALAFEIKNKISGPPK